MRASGASSSKAGWVLLRSPIGLGHLANCQPHFVVIPWVPAWFLRLWGPAACAVESQHPYVRVVDQEQSNLDPGKAAERLRRCCSVAVVLGVRRACQ
jgi:hypothetical protein